MKVGQKVRLAKAGVVMAQWWRKGFTGKVVAIGGISYIKVKRERVKNADWFAADFWEVA